MKIIPAILPDSYRGIEMNAAKVKDAVNTIQIDFVDGTFAPNRTWIFNNKDQERLSSILREEEGMPFWNDMNYELDLMVQDPLKHMETFMALGPSKIIFHVEGLDIDSTLKYLQELPEIVRTTVRFGMAINLDTDPALIAPFSEYIDTIQCMGIARIGFQGEKLDERVYGQIEKVRGLFPDKQVSVDGGVTFENATLLVQRGATSLVVGSAVFQTVDPHGTIKRFKQVCKQAATT